MQGKPNQRSRKTLLLNDDKTDLVQAVTVPHLVKMRQMSLVVSNGEETGKRYFVEDNLITVGKDPACDFSLKESTVSKLHLEIRREGDTFLVKDLGSTNGTSLNGVRINEAFLYPGSRLGLGNVTLDFLPCFTEPDYSLEKCESFGSLIAASSSMKSIMGLMRKAALSGTTVLLQGETGVGKSALAKAIHDESQRGAGPFVVFDCGSVPATLIESELFGVEKGAFTGAVQSRDGACQQAQGGTLFLDEIEDLPLELQTKLLRVLEEKEVRPLGSNQSTKLNIQFIAASKTKLDQLVETGKFRKDLYFRIAVISVDIPPLRERTDDLKILFNHFVSNDPTIENWEQITPALREQFSTYSWPGNLRELRNIIERIKCLGPQSFDFSDKPEAEINNSDSFPFDMSGSFKEAKTKLIDAFESEYLKKLLDKSGGQIAPAAREAGLNRKYFYDLLKKHGLQGRNK